MTTFDASYQSCSYTHVWLRVMHEQLDLAEISRLLELEPTSTQLAGEVISAKSGRRRRYSGWFLESFDQVESRDSRDHFAWLLDLVSGKGNSLAELVSRGCLVDICCRWDAASDNGGPTLDPAQMAKLGALGIEVWFDLYFDRQEQANA